MVSSNYAEMLNGRTLGEFLIKRHLGSGGMAFVFLAEQTSLKRRIALKVMKPELLDSKSEIIMKRFRQEALSAAGLNHPCIVQVYTIGEQDGYNFIAQEYVRGMDLAKYLKRKKRLDFRAGLHVMQRVARALAAAAGSGIIHRDIKPENILITRTGDVKVADFGLARLNDPGETAANITQAGMTVGTPHYMSPEQIRGDELDCRSDLYSFGITAFHLFTGKTPYKGKSAIDVLAQHVKDPLPKLPDEVPQCLSWVIRRLVEKKPADRYQTAEEVTKDLTTIYKHYKEHGNADQLIFGDEKPRPARNPKPKKTLGLSGIELKPLDP